MSRYKRYEKYKDSGVEWIGEIPEHWEFRRISHICALGRGRVISKIEIAENEGEYPVYSSQTENNGVLGYINTYDFEGDYITWTTDGANAGTVFRRTGRFNCTNVCGTLKSKENNLDLSYLTYALSLETKRYVRLDINPKLMNNEMAKIRVLFPPSDEQKAIANFLDQKTAEIDGLIADKEKLIELLQEKRQAIITEAVTKGLNPSVKMKDSGVEWIGEIPEHWEIGRLKNSIKSCRNGIWGDEPQGDNNDIACIRVTNFNRTNMEIEVNDLTIRNIPASKQKLYLLKYGDLLIEKSGGGEKQPVGFVTIFKHNIPAVYANFIARIELDKRKAYSGFFKYIYSAMYSIRLNVRSIKQTTGIQNLDTNYYFDERVMYPPLNEQIHIANFLDQKTAEIDDLITEIKLQIQKLKEYRQSLISEAVTGKIDVRDYVVD